MKKLIFISLLFAFGCKHTKEIEKVYITDTVKIENIKTVRDSIFYTKPDSSIFSLLFECDSNNNVLLKQLSEKTTKGFKTNVNYSNGKLDLSLYVDSIGMLNRIITELKNKEVSKTNPINVELKEKVISQQVTINELTQKVKARNRAIIVLISIIGIYIAFKNIKL